MKYLLLFTLAGCAYKPNVGESLEIAHRATESIVTVSVPIIDSVCRKAAVTCAEEGDEICHPLQQCDDFRRHFASTVILIYQTLLAADVALAVEDYQSAIAAVEKATILMRNLRAELIHKGILGA